MNLKRLLLGLWVWVLPVAARPEAHPFVEQDMLLARDYVNQSCNELLNGECRAVFDGTKLLIIPDGNLATCLRSGERKDPACPGEYSKRGAIKQLEIIRKRAGNIAQGLTLEVVVDGKKFNTKKKGA